MSQFGKEHTMTLLTLNDNKLATLHRQAAAEIARRAKAATSGHDAATIICGNEMAKRALLVAAAGNHSILFVGTPNCGKTWRRERISRFRGVMFSVFVPDGGHA
jgi:predicted ATPase with chaperone activity